MVITPSSELDAVNEILSSIGSSPVSTLEDDLNIDVINAKRILNGVSREVQSRGYAFNIRTDVTLKPDAFESTVPCPESYIKWFSTDYQLIRRSGYFFDLANQTNQFKDGITLDELIVQEDFESLPEPVRKYVTARAARLFQARFLSSPDIGQELLQSESEAYADLIDYELVSGNYNVFKDDTEISGNIGRS